jgi:hypothetical protein
VAAPVHTYDHWIFEPLSAEEKIQRKINRINGTIPERDRVQFWAGNELGCQQFWGWGIGEIFDPTPITAPEESLRLLNDYRCFIVNHVLDMSMYNKLKTLWPQARHIVLHNERRFQSRAVRLKSPDHGPLETIQLPRDLEAFYFDVDATQFNQSAVVETTERCLEWLGLNISVNSNIHNYVERYFAIHQ